MQLRDQKTLLIDVLFPIILIIAGLALATIAIFTQGPTRDLSMNALYPDIENTFYFNENALEGSTVSQADVSGFLDRNFVQIDKDLYDLGASVAIVDGTPDNNITQQAVQFDDFAFEQV